ncbi:MAG: endonuclease [Thermoprotei archaeon ex4572_64]|nr:MAG: endonuclease [Thermoprotei archaeon ex4572_64]
MIFKAMSSRKFEDFIADFLAKIGYKVLDKRVKIVINNVEVGEVDILAVDDYGRKYAIEVKSGKIDVSGIRQAYINAKIMNAIPMIIARGFSNDSAKTLAEELGVKTILLDEVFVLSHDEVKSIIEEVLYDVINEFLNMIVSTAQFDDKFIEVAEKCDDFSCLCREFKFNEDVCQEFIMKLKERINVKRLTFKKLKTYVKICKVLKYMLK